MRLAPESDGRDPFYVDPLSHALTGGVFAALVSPLKHRRLAAGIGALAGMAADLDIFLRSESDPLLTLDYHRGFTHGLVFIPFGALVVALVLQLFVQRWMRFRETFVASFAAWSVHGLLDAATSYGTRLWWPFSDERVAWNLVAVVDPLYTVPLLLLLLPLFWKRGRQWPALALSWALLYLGLGYVQQERATEAARELAQSRGHQPAVIEAKPSIFNNILFRILYEADGFYYVDAVRVGYFSKAQYFEGKRVPVLDLPKTFPNLDPDTTLARDIERFRRFSMGYLYLAPGEAPIVSDLRYSWLPNSVQPLWGIRVDPSRPEEHVEFVTSRKADEATKAEFFRMLRGRPADASPNKQHENHNPLLEDGTGTSDRGTKKPKPLAELRLEKRMWARA